MREARHQGRGGRHARPALVAPRLLRPEVAARAGGLPVVELVRADACAARPVEPVALRSELHVPRRDSLPPLSPVLEGRPQQASAAPRYRRFRAADTETHRIRRRGRRGHRPRAAPPRASARSRSGCRAWSSCKLPPRRRGRLSPGATRGSHRAGKGQLATQVLERAQVLLVVERERLVTRDGDDGPRSSSNRLQPGRPSQISGAVAAISSKRSTSALFSTSSAILSMRGELLDFVGGQTSPRCRLSSENASSAGILPKTAEDARVLLDRRLRVGAGSGARLVQHDAAHVRTRQELGDAADYGGER